MHWAAAACGRVAAKYECVCMCVRMSNRQIMGMIQRGARVPVVKLNGYRTDM